MKKIINFSSLFIFFNQIILLLFLYNIIMINSFPIDSFFTNKIIRSIIIFIFLLILSGLNGYFHFLFLQRQKINYKISNELLVMIGTILFLIIFNSIINLFFKTDKSAIEDFSIFNNYFILISIILFIILIIMGNLNVDKFIEQKNNKLLLYFIIILFTGIILIFFKSLKIIQGMINYELLIFNVKLYFYSYYIILLAYFFYIIPVKIQYIILFTNLILKNKIKLYIIISISWFLFINIYMFYIINR
jgi:hypothetical protein